MSYFRYIKKEMYLYKYHFNTFMADIKITNMLKFYALCLLKELLQISASLESKPKHPLAKANVGIAIETADIALMQTICQKLITSPI